MDLNRSKNTVHDNAKSAISQMTMEISEVKLIIRHDNDKELQRLLKESYLDVNMALST